nr:ribonuclease H-like domain-containing protein [Tanacetum cinerariifolium]
MGKTMLKQQFTEFSVTKEEGLHKGYDKFQKILSQLNQVQARLDNDDINMKFLRALPSSWSQVDQMEMEELDLKWKLAMLSLRINKFKKKAGQKINYNNKQPARFDRRKVRCYKCLQLNKTGVVEKVYGMMAGLNGDHAAKGAASVSDATTEFAMMGISPQ